MAQMTEYLQWYTTQICPDGKQKIHIRQENGRAPVEPLFLDLSQSQLLLSILDRVAQEMTLDWSAARQAVLNGFWNGLRSP
jgi:hypothetical protein